MNFFTPSLRGADLLFSIGNIFIMFPIFIFLFILFLHKQNADARILRLQLIRAISHSAIFTIQVNMYIRDVLKVGNFVKDRVTRLFGFSAHRYFNYYHQACYPVVSLVV